MRRIQECILRMLNYSPNGGGGGDAKPHVDSVDFEEALRRGVGNKKIIEIVYTI